MKCTLSCDATCDSYFETEDDGGECNTFALSDSKFNDAERAPMYIFRSGDLPSKTYQRSKVLDENFKSITEEYLEDYSAKNCTIDGAVLSLNSTVNLTLAKEANSKCVFAFENKSNKTITIKVTKNFEVFQYLSICHVKYLFPKLLGYFKWKIIGVFRN